ncbi:MAG: co-chaperone DjlA [Gammaproteobacteria bacterium]
MLIWGKILGAFFGHLILGPIGMLIGIFIGHQFDRGLRIDWQHLSYKPSEHFQAQQIFFKNTFRVMGHICKADGRVSEREIALAKNVMRRLLLSSKQRQQAIAYFQEGKQPNFDLEAAIRELRNSCGQQRILLRMFIELQIQAANVDGAVYGTKQQILYKLCQEFGFDSQEFSQQGSHQKTSSSAQTKPSLTQAYRILEISADASNHDVKKAYRKMMSKHHPDKLMSKGLPAEMLKLATEKTQQIRAAYEQIRAARNF